MKIATSKFSELLRKAEEWDQKFPALCHAQRGYLLESFIFGDYYCVYANQWDRQAWAVPWTAGGHLYTRCG